MSIDDTEQSRVFDKSVHVSLCDGSLKGIFC